MKPASLAPEPECSRLHCTLETVRNDSYPTSDVLPGILSFAPDFSSEELGLKKIKKRVQQVSSSIRTQIQVCLSQRPDSTPSLAQYSEEQDGPRVQVSGPSRPCSECSPKVAPAHHLCLGPQRHRVAEQRP